MPTATLVPTMERFVSLDPGTIVTIEGGTPGVWTKTEAGWIRQGSSTPVSDRHFRAHVEGGKVTLGDTRAPEVGDVFASGRDRFVILSTPNTAGRVSYASLYARDDRAIPEYRGFYRYGARRQDFESMQKVSPKPDWATAMLAVGLEMASAKDQVTELTTQIQALGADPVNRAALNTRITAVMNEMDIVQDSPLDQMLVSEFQFTPRPQVRRVLCHCEFSIRQRGVPIENLPEGVVVSTRTQPVISGRVIVPMEFDTIGAPGTCVCGGVTNAVMNQRGREVLGDLYYEFTNITRFCGEGCRYTPLPELAQPEPAKP